MRRTASVARRSAEEITSKGITTFSCTMSVTRPFFTLIPAFTSPSACRR
eukprot:CAMPEP_0185853962 /NCGR_PEP_ID=MMETSP1354-20130828/20845_1 /TAXON_ID=708628 /ORGANISM="Erythrolobus madagascarensis, Strain CCMP3276" /LENGTH=48 /DNA_ID= /DNA_START= /DNA_END= /DNA_ORIENTATION=